MFRPQLGHARLFPLLFGPLLTIAGCATAQRATAPPGKKEAALLAEARTDLDAYRWEEAVAGLTRLIERRPDLDQAYFLRSVGYRGIYAYERAAADIRTGMAKGEEESARAYRELGEVLSLAGSFPEAKAAYAKALALTEAGGRSERIRVARRNLRLATVADSLARNPVPFSPTPVPGRVNTREHFEYHPSISTDGSRLLFTRRVGREQEDFYFAERSADGTWGEAQPLPGLNTAFDEGAQTISTDGRYLIYTSCNSPGRNQGCDLFATSLTADGRFGPVQPLDAHVNTPHYEAQPTLSRDGRFLVFTSKRPGGKGGADLYISARLPNGTWSPPANVQALNTAGDEQYPFWAADGRTLYFTSSGHPGLGGDDLFLTRLGDDNEWSAPRNLGFPINTAENETNMFVPLAADTGYYSRRYYDPATQAIQIDLFQFPLPQAIRPDPATYLRATVVDAETGAPLEASVTLDPLTAGQLPTRFRTDASGTFLTTLPVGNDYAFTATSEGYLFRAERFRVAGGTPEAPFEVRIPLSRIEEVRAPDATSESDGSTAFTNVLFPSGLAKLLPVSFAELDHLANLLEERPGYTVVISGHTDDVGAPEDNQQLSERRAASVKAYLMEKGIGAERIETIGYGESRPVAANETAAGKAENRRVTFRLVRR